MPFAGPNDTLPYAVWEGPYALGDTVHSVVLQFRPNYLARGMSDEEALAAAVAVNPGKSGGSAVSDSDRVNLPPEIFDTTDGEENFAPATPKASESAPLPPADAFTPTTDRDV